MLVVLRYANNISYQFIGGLHYKITQYNLKAIISQYPFYLSYPIFIPVYPLIVYFSYDDITVYLSYLDILIIYQLSQNPNAQTLRRLALEETSRY